MTTLLENPWPAIVVGIVLEAVLSVWLVASRRGVVLWGMGGVLAVTAALVLVEWLVRTDREAVESRLDEAAAAVQANDADRVLECLSPSAGRLRTLAERTLALVEFHQVELDRGSLKIVVDSEAEPPSAAASVRVTAVGSDRRGMVRRHRHSERVEVSLRKEKGQWLITSYEGSDALAAARGAWP